MCSSWLWHVTYPVIFFKLVDNAFNVQYYISHIQIFQRMQHVQWTIVSTLSSQNTSFSEKITIFIFWLATKLHDRGGVTLQPYWTIGRSDIPRDNFLFFENKLLLSAGAHLAFLWSCNMVAFLQEDKCIFVGWTFAFTHVWRTTKNPLIYLLYPTSDSTATCSSKVQYDMIRYVFLSYCKNVKNSCIQIHMSSSSFKNTTVLQDCKNAKCASVLTRKEVEFKRISEITFLCASNSIKTSVFTSFDLPKRYNWTKP